MSPKEPVGDRVHVHLQVSPALHRSMRMAAVGRGESVWQVYEQACSFWLNGLGGGGAYVLRGEGGEVNGREI